MGRDAEISLFQQNLKASSAKDLRVLDFHGPDGMGKTTLLRHFVQILASGGDNAHPFAAMTLRGLPDYATAHLHVLTTLAAQLIEQFSIPMPRFELLLAVHLTHAGNHDVPWSRSQCLKDGVQRMLDHVGTGGQRQLLDDQGGTEGTPASARFTVEEALRLIGGQTGIDRLMAFTPEQLPEEIARYFVADLDRFMRHTEGQRKRVVLVLDDYEALWPGSIPAGTPQTRTADAWLRSLASFCLSAGILMVVAGRSKIRWARDYSEAGWDRDLEPRALAGWTPDQARQAFGSVLKSIGAEPAPKASVDAMLQATRAELHVQAESLPPLVPPFFQPGSTPALNTPDTTGAAPYGHLPLAVALCGDLARAMNEAGQGAPSSRELENLDKDDASSDLLTRVLERCLSQPKLPDLLFELATTPRFDMKAALELDLHRNHLMGTSGWDALLEFSFVQPAGDGWYQLHRTVRECLLARMEASALQEVNRWFNHYWTSRNFPFLAFCHAWYAAPAESLQRWKTDLLPSVRKSVRENGNGIDASTAAARSRDAFAYWSKAELAGADIIMVGTTEWCRTLAAISEALRQHSELGVASPAASNAIALHALEQVLTTLSQTETPVEWARTHRQIALALSEISMPDSAENLRLAADHLDTALLVFTKAKHPFEWAMTRMATGDVKLALARQDGGEDVQTALMQYEAALTVLNQRDNPREWTEAQNNLGDAYLILPGGDSDENVTRAITHFRAALLVLNPKDSPEYWARTQTNLGTALSDRTGGNREENLQKARQCYQEALQVYREETHPQEWAAIQNNLAAIAGEASDSNEALTRAIGHYRAALRVRSERTNPPAFALTQCNLGHTLRRFQGTGRGGAMRAAIEAYDAALRVYTQSTTPEAWARTQMHLAAAWQSMPADADTGADSETHWGNGNGNGTNTVTPGLGLKPAFGKDPHAENLQKAIHHASMALRVFREDDHLEEWARAQYFLANTYRQLPAGPAYENAVHAATCYEHALHYFSQEKHPLEWARIHLRCGITILDARDHARPRNAAAKSDALDSESAHPVPVHEVTEAVSHLQSALQVFTEARYPAEFAQASLYLTRAYMSLPPSARAAQSKQVQEASENALRHYTEPEHPHEWGLLHRFLAEHLMECGHGNRAENFRKASEHIEAAQRVQDKGGHPLAWAALHELKGKAALLSALEAAAENGARANVSSADGEIIAKLLTQAAEHYQTALSSIATAEALPQGAGSAGQSQNTTAAAGRNQQGLAYVRLTQSEQAELFGDEKKAGTYLEDAISNLQHAVRGLRENEDAYEWSRAQYNLGIAYSRRQTDRVVSLRRAIEALSASLRVRSEDKMPVEWADSQHALGLCSAMLPPGVKGENARSAYICYKAALRVYTKAKHGPSWARVHNNLGNIYSRMPPGPRGEQVSLAIQHYVSALEVFRETEYPREWALVRNNIGAALLNMPVGGRAQNLLRAINCFESALRIRTEPRSHRDWAMTQFNLGLAYRALPSGAGNENARKAEECFELVSQSQTRRSPGSSTKAPPALPV
ncbi:MAG: hypothetical protein ACAI35_12580 [Candidatus Methylacidiphilales bacterium]